MFQPVPWYRPKRYLFARYDPKPLSEFAADALSPRMKREKSPPCWIPSVCEHLLLVVMRNHTTGSAWPITNNPYAKYNHPDLPDCNMKVPLWKIVRASTAAPVYFDPEEIMLGDRKHVFVDGAITPYNNPALIAASNGNLAVLQPELGKPAPTKFD